MQDIPVKAIITVIVLVIVIGIASTLFESVPAGHVAVAALFGKVREKPYAEGLHFPVNPLYRWHLYDARQKTHKETASVPSQDQLQTTIEVSVQYRLMRQEAPHILQETGDIRNVIEVHMVPKLRSLMREQGKSVKRAEDFFLETTQETLQLALFEQLSEYLLPKGVEVQAALIRDIQLPPFITKAIESKKEREQAVEKQKAELDRFKTEQQQKVAAAEAEREAAEQEAMMRRVLAEAQAYEIEQITKATAGNTTYLHLKAMETLGQMAKDPAAKIYFINGDSPTPLPLMHVGEMK